MVRGTNPTLWSLDRSGDLVWLALGTAIGIENFFFLPSEVLYGGGLTVLVLHVLCVLLLAAPLVMAELLWGRWLLRPYVQAYKVVGMGWMWVPLVSLGALVLIFPPYLIDVGSLGVLALETVFRTGQSPAGLRAQIETSPLRSYLGALSLLSFCAGAVLTSSRSMAGIVKNLLRFSIPAWAVLTIYTVQNWGFEGLGRVLAWRPETLTWSLAFRVASFSLFTLSAGFGIFFTYVYYASQIPLQKPKVGQVGLWQKQGGLLRIVGWVVVGDLMASVVSVCLVSPYGLGAVGQGVERRSSAVLMLDWVPQIFLHQPYGIVWVFVYYMSVLCAGVAAAISIFDCLLFQTEREFNWPRAKAVWHVWAFCAILATLPLIPLFKEVMGFVGAQFLLPLSALLMSYVIGWKMPERAQRSIFGRGLILDRMFILWRFSIRFLVPMFLLYLLLR